MTVGLLSRRGPLASRVSSSIYRQAVVADSPVSWWRLADPSGTTAVDEQAAHSGTYVNTPTLGSAGAFPDNAAVTFASASSQTVDCGDLSLFEAGDCTYEAWVKSATLAEQTAFSEGTSAGTNGFARLYIAGSGVATAAARNDAGTTYTVSGAANLVGTAFHHVVLVKSGTTLSLYADGAATGTPATVSGTFTQNKSRIGALGRSSDAVFFNGTIDEVAVYNYALSAASIAAHYAARI